MEVGQSNLALATLREADDFFAALDRAGSLNKAGHSTWSQVVCSLGIYYLPVHQIDAAKECFLRIINWPRLQALDRLEAHRGMARCFVERKEWNKVKEYCGKALALLPVVRSEPAIPGIMQNHAVSFGVEGKVLLLLADAYEALGDMERALEYDAKAEEVYATSGVNQQSAQAVPMTRREALVIMAEGEPLEAVEILGEALEIYRDFVEFGDCNPTDYALLQQVVPALHVLVDALVQTRDALKLGLAGRIRADVEETEGIAAGYWEGVLEETRWELEERRRVAAAAAAATTKKKKAAKRKQQKRKAQQQMKAAQSAEAAAVAGAARGDDDTQGQGEEGKKEEQQEQNCREEEVEEQEAEKEQAEINSQQAMAAMAAAAAAFAAMAVSEEKGHEEEGQEKEDECSVCLNAIESNDADNPAGSPLVCGHRYHAFCLQYWAEKCASKCIEATCPYCRAPLQEVVGV